MDQFSTLDFSGNTLNTKAEDLIKQAEAEVSPKQSTIDNILNFSKAYEVQRTEKLGNLGMVMN